MVIINWCLDIKRLDRVANDTVRTVIGVVPICWKLRLGWSGHVMRRDEDNHNTPSNGVASKVDKTKRKAKTELTG